LVGAVASASSYGLPDVELRARVNLSYAAAAEDPQLAYRTAREGVERARHLGMGGFGYYLLGNAALVAIAAGDWEWVLSETSEAMESNPDDLAARLRHAQVVGLRGGDTDAEFEGIAQEVADYTEGQVFSSIDEARASVELARGEARRALDLARRAYERVRAPDSYSCQIAIRAAAWLGDSDAVSDALRTVEGEPGRVPAAVRREGKAALAAVDGRRSEALTGFLDAIRRWRDVGLDVEAASCALNLVTLLGPSEPLARAAADDAAALFERLGAEPFQERLADAMRGQAAVAGPSAAPEPVREPRASAARVD
jgi:hypothetical protein